MKIFLWKIEKLKEKQIKVSCKECLLKYAAKLISFSSKSKSQASVLIESAEKNVNKFALKDYTNTVYNNRKNRLNFADIPAETQKGLRKKSRTSPEKTRRRKSSQSICKQHGTSMP